MHDAYTLTPKGEPLLAGRRGADGAIFIVRDPRDVAPSLANHNRAGIDDAITLMNDPQAVYCAKPGRLHDQLRQRCRAGAAMWQAGSIRATFRCI